MMQDGVSAYFQALREEQVADAAEREVAARKEEMRDGFSAYFRALREEQVENAAKRGEILE